MSHYANLAGTFATRGLGALGGYLFAVAVARLSGSETLGEITVFISLVGACAILGRRGIGIMLVRDVGRIAPSERAGRAFAAFSEAMQRTWKTAALATISGAALLCSGILGDGPVATAGWFLLACPLYFVLASIGFLVQGLGKTWSAPLFEIGWASLVATIVLIGLHPLLLAQFDPTVAMAIAFAVALGVIAGFAALWTRRIFRPATHTSQADGHDHVSREQVLGEGDFAFTIVTISTFLMQAGMFLLCAPFLAAEDLGLLRGAERLAILVSFASLAINPFISPLIARAVSEGRVTSIRRTLYRAGMLGLFVGLPLCLALIAFPELALSLMGEEFRLGAGYLVPMAIANLIYVSLVPAVVTLNMAGRERESMRISLATLCVALVFVPLGAIYYGAPGVVASYCATLIMRAGLSWIVVHFTTFRPA